MKRPVIIFGRAFFKMLLTGASIFFISNQMILPAVVVAGGTGLVWTLNVRDLSIATWTHRISYIIGCMIGLYVSLSILYSIFG